MLLHRHREEKGVKDGPLAVALSILEGAGNGSRIVEPLRPSLGPVDQGGGNVADHPRFSHGGIGRERLRIHVLDEAYGRRAGELADRDPADVLVPRSEPGQNMVNDVTIFDCDADLMTIIIDHDKKLHMDRFLLLLAIRGALAQNNIRRRVRNGGAAVRLI